MATTSNFGWTTPDDTDLVKDGAAAIRTLGSAIDTSLVDLKGGTTGQNLRKASNTDLDFTFAGDATNTVVDAAGDLLYGTAADTLGRLAIGTAGQVLKVNSGATAPEWATASAAALTLITRTSYSNVASQTFDNVFTTTYKTYLIIVEKHEAVTVNDSFEFIFRYGTTDATGHNGNCIYATTGGTGTAAGTTNAASLKVNIGSGSSVYPLNAVMYVHNVGTGSSIRPGIYGEGWEQFNTRMFQFAGSSDNNQNMTGFKVKSSNTNITGTIAVYGYGV